MSKVDTNLEAYRLVGDPTRLLYLLFTKYGDIEEDFNNLIVNQLLYNKLSHLNSLFKENFFINNRREFFKRIYKKKESKDRIPKLFDYYRNYYDYFCKPFFLNFFSANLLHNYYNNKAEIFYKNNYSSSIEKNEEDNNNNNNDNDNGGSESLSSLDNDTENKTIFTKRNKYIIDNNIDSNKCSITLTFDNSVKDNKGLISKRSTNDSFKRGIEYFIHEYQVIDNKKRNNKLLKTEDNKIINSNEINENFFKNKINDLKNKNNDLKENDKLNKNIKDKSYNLISDDNKNIEDIIQRINQNKKIASKLSRNSSNFEEFKKYTNNVNKLKKNIHDIVKNKFWTNNRKIIKNNDNESKNNKNIINEKEPNEKTSLAKNDNTVNKNRNINYNINNEIEKGNCLEINTIELKRTNIGSFNVVCTDNNNYSVFTEKAKNNLIKIILPIRIKTTLKDFIHRSIFPLLINNLKKIAYYSKNVEAKIKDNNDENEVNDNILVEQTKKANQKMSKFYSGKTEKNNK